MKKLSKIVAICISLVCILVTPAMAETRYVTAPSGLNIRNMPNGEIITAVKYGTALEVVSDADGWSKVNINGNHYHCANQYLSNSKPSYTTGSGKSLGVFTLTGYCTCRKCCGKWSPEVTGKQSYTAMGTTPTMNRTIAVDPSVIPLGTWVEINIPGVGWQSFRAEDTGSHVKGKHIDIFAGSHSNAYSPKYNKPAEVRLK